MKHKILSLISILLVSWGVYSSCEEYNDPVPFSTNNKISTSPATDVTRNSAIIHGQLNFSSNSIKGVGFRFSTSQTLSEYQEVNAVNNGGQITADLKGLNGNTTYYYCVYATGGYSTITSGISSFTTLPYSAPSVNKPEASNIVETGFTLTASTLDKGGTVILDLGFQYIQIEDANNFDNNFSGAQQINSKVTSDIEDISKNVSQFQATISGLNSGKVYAVRSYCQNGQGTSYSDAIFVTTTSIDLSETTTTNILNSSAHVEATIQRANNSTISERGFVYSTSNFNAYDKSLNRVVAKSMVDNSFSATIEGLKETTTYYIAAYVTTQYGTTIGPVNSFTTSERFSVTPLLLEMESEAGSKTIVVTSVVPFSVKKDADWLSIKTEDKTITVTTETNTNRESRQGSITISPDDNSDDPITVQVFQAAASVYFDVDTVPLTFKQVGGIQTIKVTATDSWTAKTDASWLTLSPKSGSSDAEISVAASENTAKKDREAIITIASNRRGTYKVKVTQVRTEAELSTTSDTIYNINKNEQTIKLNIASNSEWVVDVPAGDSWCSVSPAKGSNDGTITVSLKANEDVDTRTATVRVKSEGNKELYFDINQSGTTPIFSVDKKEFSVSSYSQYDLYVKLNCNMRWTAKVENGVSWLRIISPEGNWYESYSSKGSIDLHIYVYDDSSSATKRSSKITITTSNGDTAEILVTQEPKTSIIINGYEDDVKYE